LATAADEFRQGRNGGLTLDIETAAQIVPESDAVLGAGFGEAEEGIAAIAADVAACSCADFALGHLASDVVFRAVGVERDVGPVEDGELCLPLSPSLLAAHQSTPRELPQSQRRNSEAAQLAA